MNSKKKHRRDSKQARELERQKIYGLWQKILNFLLSTKKTQPQTPRILKEEERQEAHCTNKTKTWDYFKQIEEGLENVLACDAKGKFSPL